MRRRQRGYVLPYRSATTFPPSPEQVRREELEDRHADPAWSIGTTPSCSRDARVHVEPLVRARRMPFAVEAGPDANE